MFSIYRAVSPPGVLRHAWSGEKLDPALLIQNVLSLRKGAYEGSQTENVYHEGVDRSTGIECRREHVVVFLEPARLVAQRVKLREERNDEAGNQHVHRILRRSDRAVEEERDRDLLPKAVATPPVHHPRHDWQKRTKDEALNVADGWIRVNARTKRAK